MEFLFNRKALAESLKKAGYRVVSPFKVQIGWIDIAVFGRMSIGLDFYAGNLDSCIERLNSYPFKDRKVIGFCSNCKSLESIYSYFNLDYDKRIQTSSSISENIIDELPSTKAAAILGAVAFIYMAKEIFKDRVDDYSYKNLGILLPELSYWNLITESSISKIKPKYFVSLSRDGYRLAEEVIRHRISRSEKKLKKLAKDPISYVLAVGLSRELRVVDIGLKPEDYSFKSLMKFMSSVPIEFMNVFKAENPKAQVCEFLTKTVLNSKAIDLAKELMNMGLAVKVKTYSPYGEEIEEEYRFAREAIEVLLKLSYASIDEELINEFLALVYPLFNYDVYPILNNAKEYFIKAKEAGVCEFDGYRLRIFESFEKYARLRLPEVIEKIMSNLSL